MSNNEINITLNISDELLAKLIMAIKPQNQSMGIPLQALMGMAMQPQALPKGDKPKEKPSVGFKVNGGTK
jgi:predicted DNA binding CopG/RHH family protein